MFSRFCAMFVRIFYIFFALVFAAQAYAKDNISFYHKTGREEPAQGLHMSLFSIKDAMKAYLGRWRGEQSVFLLNGEKVSSFKVEQSFTAAGESELAMTVKFELPNGKNVFSQWKIEDLGSVMRMSLIDESGKPAPKYIGRVQLSGVSWEPVYCVLAYDVMFDSFERGADGFLYFISTSYSTLFDGKASGILRGKSVLKKIL